jgi:3-methyladenine DNA glycosylase AlkD
MVPTTRKIVKKYIQNITLFDIQELLCSPWHEIRLAGVLFLVQKFQKGNQIEQEDIFHFYLKHTKYINNWDLVDVSAPYIIGAYLFDKKRDILKSFAQSDDLWERRISIIATFFFIRKGDYITTFSIIEILL